MIWLTWRQFRAQAITAAAALAAFAIVLAAAEPGPVRRVSRQRVCQLLRRRLHGAGQHIH